MGHISQYLIDRFDEAVGDAIDRVQSGGIEQEVVSLAITIAFDKDGRLTCSHASKAATTVKGSWRPPVQAQLPGIDGAPDSVDAEEVEAAGELENSIAEETDELMEAAATVLEGVFGLAPGGPDLPPPEGDQGVHCTGCGRDLEGQMSWTIGPPNDGGRRLCADCVELEKRTPEAPADEAEIAAAEAEASARVRGVPPQEAPEEDQFDVPAGDTEPAGLEPAAEPAPQPAPRSKGGRPPVLFACSGCLTPVRAVEAWGVSPGAAPVALKRNDRASNLRPGEKLLCAKCTSDEMEKRPPGVRCPHNIVHSAGQEFGVNCPVCRAEAAKAAAEARLFACHRCGTQVRASEAWGKKIGELPVELRRVDRAENLRIGEDLLCPTCAEAARAVEIAKRPPEAETASEAPAAEPAPMVVGDTLKCDGCGQQFPTKESALVDHVGHGPDKNEGSILCPVCLSTRTALGIGEEVPAVYLGDTVGWPGGDGAERTGECMGIFYPPPEKGEPALNVHVGEGAMVFVPYATPGLRVVSRRPLPAKKGGGKRGKKAVAAGGSPDTGNGTNPTDQRQVQPGTQITGLDSPRSEVDGNGASTEAGPTEDVTEATAPLAGPNVPPGDGAPAPASFPYAATGAGGHCAGCRNPLPDDRGISTRKQLGMRFSKEGKWLCPDCTKLLAVVA